MMARISATFLSILLMAGLLSDHVYARSRIQRAPNMSRLIVEGAPTLAPFQHVRFCLHYPGECKSDPTGHERIELTTETADLLNRINQSVNEAITPRAKSYGSDLADSWTLDPRQGDCNDYAVTKRHELLQSGLPSNALRLSVVKTTSGVGHLVLVVSTTKEDLVLDNLSNEIRSWQRTNYDWIKIQSSEDARFWYDVKTNALTLSQQDEKVVVDSD